MYKRLTNLLVLTLISLPLCAMDKGQEQIAQTQQTQQDAKAKTSWLTWKNAGIATGVGLTALAIYGGLHKVEVKPEVIKDGNKIAAQFARGGFSGALKAVKSVAVVPVTATWDYAIRPACGYISNKLPAMSTVKSAISSKLPTMQTVKSGAVTTAKCATIAGVGASVKPAYNFVFSGKEDTKQLLQICADCFAGIVEKKDFDKAQENALKCTKDKELKSLIEKFFIALKADKKSDAQAIGVKIREYINQ